MTVRRQGDGWVAEDGGGKVVAISEWIGTSWFWVRCGSRMTGADRDWLKDQVGFSRAKEAVARERAS